MALVTIPDTASPFYVTDSYTVSPISAPSQNHYPGVFNMNKTWPPNTPVTVYLLAGDLGAIPYATDIAGMNVDVQIGIYDVTSGPASFVSVLPFVSPYGSAANGMVMNLVAIYGAYSHVVRDWTKCPLVVSGLTPNVGTTFQIGAKFTFFHGGNPITAAYNYYLLGAAE